MRFSIVTIVINDADGLARTLDSIQRQTCANYEWIVVDGGSTDGSVEIVRNMPLKAIKWISEPDDGIYDAMNKGVALAGGEYVVFMNAGDTFAAPTALSHVDRVCRDSQTPVDVVFGGATLRFPNGRRRYRPPYPAAEYIWHGLPANHQATYYRRVRMTDKPYDISYRFCGDYYLTARLVREGAQSALIDTALAEFEVGGTSYQNPVGLVREAARVQREILGLGRLRRLQSATKRIVNTVAFHVLAQRWSRWLGTRHRKSPISQ